MLGQLRKIPVAFGGLSLGLLGVASNWGSLFGSIPIYIGLLCASVFLIPLILRHCFHPDLILEEIQDPTVGSYLPTLDMSLLMLSGVLMPYTPTIGTYIWYIAIAIHILLFTSFIFFQLQKLSWDHIIPSWFIPSVGVCVSTIVNTPPSPVWSCEIITYISIILYAFLLPVVLYRILFYKLLEDKVFPSFAVLAAPANLCLSGYLTSCPNPKTILVIILLALGICFTGLVYLSIIRLRQIPFSPIYASYTFPLGIGITAIRKFIAYLEQFTSTYTSMLLKIMWIHMIVTTIIVLYIAIQMIIWIHHSLHQS